MEDSTEDNLTTRSLLKGILATEPVRTQVMHRTKQRLSQRPSTSYVHQDESSSSPSMNLRSKMRERVRRSVGKSALEVSVLKRNVETNSKSKRKSAKKGSHPIMQDLDTITPRTLLKKIIQNEDEVSILVSQRSQAAAADDKPQEDTPTERLSSLGSINLSLPDLQDTEHVTVFKASRKKRKMRVSEFEREVDERLPKNKDKQNISNDPSDNYDVPSLFVSSYTISGSAENKLDLSAAPESTFKRGLLRRPNKVCLVSLDDFEQGVEDKYQQLKGSQECFIEPPEGDKSDANEMALLNTVLYAQSLRKEANVSKSDRQQKGTRKHFISSHEEIKEADDELLEPETKNLNANVHPILGARILKDKTNDGFRGVHGEVIDDTDEGEANEDGEEVEAGGKEVEAVSDIDEEASGEEDKAGGDIGEEVEAVSDIDEEVSGEEVEAGGDIGEEVKAVGDIDEEASGEEVDAGGDSGEEVEAVGDIDEEASGEEVDAGGDIGEEVDAGGDSGEEVEAGGDSGEEDEPGGDSGEEVDAGGDIGEGGGEEAAGDSGKEDVAAGDSGEEDEAAGDSGEGEAGVDLKDVQSSMQQNKSSLINRTRKSAGVSEYSHRVQQTRLDEENAVQIAESIYVHTVSRPEETSEPSESSDVENLDVAINRGMAKKKETNKLMLSELPETPAYIKSARFVSTAKPAVSKKIQRKRSPKAKKTGSVFSSSQIKQIFTHHSQVRVSKDALEDVEKCLDLYVNQLAVDLSTYTAHANRKTVTRADMELLMKRQRLVTDVSSLNVLIEKHLPLECRALLIPCAMSGNKVFPKM